MKEYFRPCLFCFVGPAGSGKSSISRQIVTANPELCSLSISTTTRAPRRGEVDGVSYNFVSEDEFAEKVATGAFIEHARFSSHCYGTERESLKRQLESGRHVILDIEVEGVKQLKNIFAERLVTVFVMPPSLAELESRLRGRGTEGEEEIERRMNIARGEIAILSATGFADYLLINDSLPQAIIRGLEIVHAAACRMSELLPDKRAEIFGA
ncbi:MAG: guanylate kinase [bacterium]|nr:guanylate kinase [bacterium]